MLALVPWVLAHPGVTIEDLARRFAVPVAEMERDLEFLPLCGLPPYTADRLIDVSVGEDGAVTMRLAEYFDRPLRLSPAEGLALLAAGRTLLQVPGADPEGPLGTALQKLEGLVGVRGGLAVDVTRPVHLEVLQRAVSSNERVELDYYSFSRDEMTTRLVEPVRVFHAFGSWYLDAYCHLAGAERMFRVDRVRAVRPTGIPFEAPSADDEALTEPRYRPSEADLRVRLRLSPGAAWVVEELPLEEATALEGGGYEVVLAVSAPAFLERLMLRLGPDAEVVDPAEARTLVTSAARRLLERYERGGRG